ncbi:MAG: hypothetical protein A2845_01515 [Candidatus Lloydbacteria bacterium RIFCSPHIGHO2_01_FULL_49_22]|uniref:Uncharacterized protein n=1 Tax=Candidatus Lloydbacteria bacterium RIFCSPHIGHO2_01_FULL_49_22 TaxID=1798658 RepID=A0A1G2CXK3_9BACT|nr:MAG: hypothetical protein A2845_01515 [Candidatus Lloydbacteria bacterium RIFCSPHIGHO2_01_FULL_49_22]OGZ09975.1 MAG: hypothetical protein A3C14_04680 [Candidatus Lloydbacteria bacterium RIFCSPHIGHO2_02_FULL_50_18]
MLHKIGVAFTLLMILALGTRGYFVNDDIANQTLEPFGYTNIKVIDKSILIMSGCVRGDSARLTVSATSPQGKSITLYVCTSWPFGRNTISVP